MRRAVHFIEKGHEYGDYGMLNIKDQVDCDGDEFDEYSTETNSEGESIAAIAYSGPKKIIYERVRAFFLEKDPERIATSKGQNIQNLENTKKINEELESELIKAEEKYNSINLNLKNIQEKLTIFRENKARNEATLSGIEQRKKDLPSENFESKGFDNLDGFGLEQFEPR